MASQKTNGTRQANHQRKLESATSGTARAALLGISDGLVTNLSLIIGIAGAGVDNHIVRLAGAASLIAGAISMAVGEYISMRGQVELLGSILVTERAELNKHPQNVRQQLAEILSADGVAPATAQSAAKEIAANPEQAMNMYARGKLGINPSELGSPWGSAISSFIMFSMGAAIPLIPWYFATNTTATIISISISVLAALGIGAYLGVNTNGKWGRSAIRQLIVLLIAAGATFLVGSIFRVNVA